MAVLNPFTERKQNHRINRMKSPAEYNSLRETGFFYAVFSRKREILVFKTNFCIVRTNFLPTFAGILKKTNSILSMKKVYLVLSIVVVALISSCGSGVTGGGSMKSFEDSHSYVLGADFGRQMMDTKKNLEEKGKLNFNMDLVLQGFSDSKDTTKLKFTPDQTKGIITRFNETMKKKQQEADAEKKGLSDKFLEENKTKEGVKTTASGLQYKVISSGAGGASPAISDTVTVHYTGTLLNGEKFDSSIDRGQPAKFLLGNVIKGWQEGLQLMKPGDKYILYIPSDLGYGPMGDGSGRIGGNEMLIFDVELIGFKKGKPGAAPKNPAMK